MSISMNDVIISGSPLFVKDSIGNDVATYYLGGKDRLEFTCCLCGNSIMTDSEFRYGERALVEGTLYGKLHESTRSIGDVFDNIPVVGRFMGRRVEENLDGKVEAIRDNEDFKLKSRAFEEIKHRFSTCSKCGNYACDVCSPNNLCKTCNGNVGISAEIDIKIKEIEEMYNGLIAANPSLREIFETQKKQTIDGLSDAKRNISG